MGKVHRENPVLALYWPCTGLQCFHEKNIGYALTNRIHVPTKITVSIEAIIILLFHFSSNCWCGWYFIRWNCERAIGLIDWTSCWIQQITQHRTSTNQQMAPQNNEELLTNIKFRNQNPLHKDCCYFTYNHACLPSPPFIIGHYYTLCSLSASMQYKILSIMIE